MLAKKRRGPKPTGINPMVGVRIAPDLLDALDAWRTAQDDKPSRPEAVRRILADRLRTKGE